MSNVLRAVWLLTRAFLFLLLGAHLELVTPADILSRRSEVAARALVLVDTLRRGVQFGSLLGVAKFTAKFFMVGAGIFMEERNEM